VPKDITGTVTTPMLKIYTSVFYINDLYVIVSVLFRYKYI